MTTATAAKQAQLYTVRKQGRQWGVFDEANLVEGGFFDRAAAEVVREEYEKSARAAIAKAEAQ